MLFIIASQPGTEEFKRACAIAKGSNVCLIQDAVYLAMEENAPTTGSIYALKDDLLMRSITNPKIKGLKTIDYSEMVDLMAGAEKVTGVF